MPTGGIAATAAGTTGAKAVAPAFFWIFGLTIVVAVVAIVTLRAATPSREAIEEEGLRWVLNALPSDEIAALKLDHARAAARYGIGLFGNSRILMIGGPELGLGERRAFNFAIPGQSIRQSISLVEELAAAGKLPDIIVISMDHAELGLQGGAAVFPGPPRRWLRAASDFRIALAREGWRASAVHVINTLASEARELAITFNFNFMTAKAWALFRYVGPPSAYRQDGSRQEGPAAANAAIGTLPRRSERYPQLEADFERLAAVRQAGQRIIIYESPVAPELANTVLSDNARDVRRRFETACAKHRFECFGPPLLADRKWFDRDHAPADALGAWLREIIQRR